MYVNLNEIEQALGLAKFRQVFQRVTTTLHAKTRPCVALLKYSKYLSERSQLRKDRVNP